MSYLWKMTYGDFFLSKNDYIFIMAQSDNTLCKSVSVPIDDYIFIATGSQSDVFYLATVSGIVQYKIQPIDHSTLQRVNHDEDINELERELVRADRLCSKLKEINDNIYETECKLHTHEMSLVEINFKAKLTQSEIDEIDAKTKEFEEYWNTHSHEIDVDRNLFHKIWRSYNMPQYPISNIIHLQNYIDRLNKHKQIYTLAISRDTTRLHSLKEEKDKILKRNIEKYKSDAVVLTAQITCFKRVVTEYNNKLACTHEAVKLKKEAMGLLIKNGISVDVEIIQISDIGEYIEILCEYATYIIHKDSMVVIAIYEHTPDGAAILPHVIRNKLYHVYLDYSGYYNKSSWVYKPINGSQLKYDCVRYPLQSCLQYTTCRTKSSIVIIIDYNIYRNVFTGHELVLNIGISIRPTDHVICDSFKFTVSGEYIGCCFETENRTSAFIIIDTETMDLKYAQVKRCSKLCMSLIKTPPGIMAVLENKKRILIFNPLTLDMEYKELPLLDEKSFNCVISHACIDDNYQLYVLSTDSIVYIHDLHSDDVN